MLDPARSPFGACADRQEGVDDVSDSEFGIEVPEADRLEQLQDAEPGVGPAEDAQDDPPVFDTGAANPADVFEQQLEVPRGDDEDW
jgi:hypothetical protein